VVTSSAGFHSWLGQRGIESIVVENRPAEKEVLPPAEHFTVGYLGRVREVESFEFLLEAVKLIPEVTRPRLLIAGDGNAAVQVAELVRIGQNEGWLEAEVFGAFDSLQLAEMMREVSVMYALYPPFRGNIMDGALPVKMFDAASYGRPSVVNAGCHMAEVCESEGLGVATEWADAQALADALVQADGLTVKLSRGEQGEKQRFMAQVNGLFELTSNSVSN
jgi:glycosyltransferase involved in cell wall biosynthesis